MRGTRVGVFDRRDYGFFPRQAAIFAAIMKFAGPCSFACSLPESKKCRQSALQLAAEALADSEVSLVAIRDLEDLMSEQLVLVSVFAVFAAGFGPDGM